jgi:hypothetical protein
MLGSLKIRIYVNIILMKVHYIYNIYDVDAKSRKFLISSFRFKYLIIGIKVLKTWRNLNKIIIILNDKNKQCRASYLHNRPKNIMPH